MKPRRDYSLDKTEPHSGRRKISKRILPLAKETKKRDVSPAEAEFIK